MKFRVGRPNPELFAGMPNWSMKYGLFTAMPGMLAMFDAGI
jgi:hypothetical protein